MPETVQVIIPYYNKHQYVAETVRSVEENKTDLTVSITIVDDCSPQPVPLSLRGYNILRTPQNAKLSGARNYGIRNTSSDYIICLDSDDLIPTNYIQTCYDKLQEGYDITYCNSIVFGLYSQVIDWPEYDERILKRNPFINCSAMYRRTVFDTVGGYDESMTIGWEDYDFWLSAAKAKFKFAKNNNSSLYYRQDGTNMINETNAKLPTIIEYLKNKHKGFYHV